MVDQPTKNQNKLDILELISNKDEFYLLDVEELELINRELKSPWVFDQSGPTYEEYLKTFPGEHDLMHSKVKNAIKNNFDNPKGKIRAIGFGGYRQRSDNTKTMMFAFECQCGVISSARSMAYSCGCLKESLNKIHRRIKSRKFLESKIGEKHNRLEIIAVSPEVYKNQLTNYPLLIVRCECGKSEPFSVRYTQLLPRKRKTKDGKITFVANTRSCGCLEAELVRERHRKNAEKSINEIKGQLKILSLAGYHPVSNKQLVNALCMSCNTETIIRLNDWRTGQQSTCGCKIGTLKRKSYIGTKLFFLEVLSDAQDRILEGGRRVRFVRCKCHACGRKDYELRLDNIINKQQISCGCMSNSTNDSLLNFATDHCYSERESTTYIVLLEYKNVQYLKVGIAFNFSNRKSVAKKDGIPYVKVVREINLARAKSWLLEQILLLKFDEYRMKELGGKVGGGTEIFNEKISLKKLLIEFDKEYKLMRSMTFQDRLDLMGCNIPSWWEKGYYN